MAPELQLLVSQLSSSLELVLRWLELGLQLRRLTFELCKLFRLEAEPFTVGENPCRLETDPGPRRVGEERLDGERCGGSPSLRCPENTGHEAVDEHEPRSCLLDVILTFGRLFGVETKVPLTVTPRPVFEEPFCIFA